MKKIKIVTMLYWLFVLVMTVFVFLKSPDKIPSQYDIHGNVSSYGTKYVLFIIPLITLITFIVKDAVSRLDPRQENFKTHMRTYNILIYIIIAFLCSIQLIILKVVYTSTLHLEFISILISIILIVTGNWLPKLKSNYFIGIKTPWTLSSEESWYKTHRFAGKVCVLVGVISIIFTVVCFLIDIASYVSLVFTVSLLLLSMLYITVYSYKEYKKSDDYK